MVKSYIEHEFKGYIGKIMVEDALTYNVSLDILDSVEAYYDIEVSDRFIWDVVDEVNIWLYQYQYSVTAILNGTIEVMQKYDTFNSAMFQNITAILDTYKNIN